MAKGSGSIRKLSEEKIEEKAEFVRSKISFSELTEKIMEVDEINSYWLSTKETVILDSITEGLSTAMAFYDLMEAEILDHKLKNGDEKELSMEDKLFLNMYSFYAGSVKTIMDINKITEERPTVDGKWPAKKFADYVMSPAELSGKIISEFYDGLVDGMHADNENFKINNDKKFIDFTYAYFMLLKNSLVEESKNEKFKTLVDFVKGTDIQIDGIVVNGFDFNVDGIEKTIKSNITWDDIVGNDRLKRSLKKYAQNLFFYDPEKKINPVTKLSDLPRTALIFARPGTGKTMCLQATINYMQQLSEISGKKFGYVILDSSLKDKYLGEYVKKMKAELEKAADPGRISLIIIEDIDAVIASRNDDSTCAAEKDGLAFLMNWVEGINTEYFGNYIVLSTTNHGEEIDLALRQRLGQVEIPAPGPETLDDYIKIMNKQLNKGISKGYVNITPYQNNKKDDIKWQELGEILKSQNFSGRDCRNVAVSLTEKATDIDISKEMYNLSQEKLEQELVKKYKKINYDDIKSAIKEYIEVKKEQLKVDKDSKIRRRADEMHIQNQAIKLLESDSKYQDIEYKK